jgi:uncharacterized membrane protein YraQ (UPF0718 family)
MRKELGKFFIDVAKLIIAGVLLATIIHDVTNRWLIYTLGSTSVFTLLIIGLYLVTTNQKEE